MQNFQGEEKQVKAIMKTYAFSKFCMQTAISAFPMYVLLQARISEAKIKQLLKREIKETVMGIESLLYSMKKIPSLFLYDHQSPSLFDCFLDLERIIPASYEHDFYVHFENIKESNKILPKCLYHPEHADSRETIYQAFLDYARKQHLFSVNSELFYEKPPYEFASYLFDLRDLDLIYSLFCRAEGDFNRLSELMVQKDFPAIEAEPSTLEQKLNNIQLIGLFHAHKASAKAGGYRIVKWGEFKDRHCVDKRWKHSDLTTLLRIGIRKNPTEEELKRVMALMDLEYKVKKRSRWKGKPKDQGKRKLIQKIKGTVKALKGRN